MTASCIWRNSPLTLAGEWLASHPLTQADLATEIDYLQDRDLALEIGAS